MNQQIQIKWSKIN